MQKGLTFCSNLVKRGLGFEKYKKLLSLHKLMEALVKKYGKFLVLGIITAVVACFFIFDLKQYLTLSYIQSQKDSFVAFYHENVVQTIAVYMLIYIATTALSLPGATILTLAGGAIFGFASGTIIVSFASTMGASLAFLASRLVMRDWVQSKFGDKLRTFNEGVEKEGAFYLFTLRLIPVVPFFVINLVMGLTPLSVIKFFIVSQIGMLAGTAVYVNAGTQLMQLESLGGIMSPALLGSFALLGIFPFIAKGMIQYLKTRKLYARFTKPSKFDFNVLVVGAGSAGLVSAYIAAAVKAKVGLIEKHKMGGDCLNTGCVPSKALIKTARAVYDANHAEKYGLENYKPQINFATVMERVQSVVQKIEPHDSVERYTGLGVDCIQGHATIKNPWEVEVEGKKLTAKNIIVASGAGPLVPPFDGLGDIKYYTTDDIWELREKPKSLLVLGGGPIGCELAQAFSRLGIPVTQVEMGSRLLPREDQEVSDYVVKQFQKEGIKVMLGHKAKKFLKESTTNVLVAEANGQDVRIEFDQVLFALGRAARISNFGLDQLGIELTKQKTIKVNEFLQTNYPNIYVCGDAAGPYQFTHVAAHQAWYCAVNALFSPLKKFKVDYRVIPWCTFIDPEVARVGLNELEAIEKGIEYEVTTYGIDDLDRAIADSADTGFVKVLTVPGKDRILGVTIMGLSAGELIAEYVTAMKWGLGMNKILGTIHIYPTLAEANKYAAGNWKKAHSPEKLLEYVRKFHAWRRS